MFYIPKSLIDKYAVIGPRYTSYPTAPMWYEVNREQQQDWFLKSQSNRRPLSLYIHIPFCKQRCTYCGCNVVVTRQQERSAEYVRHLVSEINNLGKYEFKSNKIKQLHFGGGTPNFLLDEEFTLLMAAITTNFEFSNDAEIAIEVDPSMTRPQQLEFLRKIGVNRVSFGVQDLSEQVQKAVNRIQSREITLDHLQLARELGITGINFDLIYGLPYQTLESFQQTVDEVIKMRPDRLAVYNFGYLPNRMLHQRKIDPNTLPDADTKMKILLDTINRFCQAGYNYIGMDHFALSDDELSIAQKNRTLHRNFMGYTPKSGVNLFGIGMTSISEFEHYFLQNERKLKSYEQQITESGLAGCRGIALSRDDQVRKWTILRLICHFYLDFTEFESKFGISFSDYFHEELHRLEELENDGLLKIDSTCIKVVDHGQILVRNICMVFDAYLGKSDIPQVKYSQTI